MRYRAVLFDLDGTLLDTLADLADSANRVLAAENMPVHPISSYKYFVGDGLHTLVERMVPAEQRDEKTIDRLAELFRLEYGKNWHLKSHPYSGVPEMLATVQKEDVRLAVLSNKPHEFTRLCVQRLLQGFSFYPVLGQRNDVPKKPDPAGALEVVNMLDIPPEDFLYLGDTAIDMQTATAAGMTAVGVLWGFRDEEELRSSGADYLLRHPGELLELLPG